MKEIALIEFLTRNFQDNDLKMLLRNLTQAGKGFSLAPIHLLQRHKMYKVKPPTLYLFSDNLVGL